MSTQVSAIDRLVGGIQDALVERAIVTISVKDACRLTQLSERSIRKFVAEGRLKSKKIGARRLLDLSDVQKLCRI